MQLHISAQPDRLAAAAAATCNLRLVYAASRLHASEEASPSELTSVPACRCCSAETCSARLRKPDSRELGFCVVEFCMLSHFWSPSLVILPPVRCFISAGADFPPMN